jgi:hypothetical protein
MKFRNYCIVFIGDVKGVQLEVRKISEESKFLGKKGMTISTFVSVAEPAELSDYFKSFDRNFLLFDLNEDYSRVNLLDKTKAKELFKIVDKHTDKTLEEMSNKLIDDINENISKIPFTGNSKSYDMGEPLFSKIMEPKTYKKKVDLESLSKKQKEEIINDILDKGYDNLNEYDIKMLDKVSKNI